MGNDGGSIPTRRELVKEAARALTASELKESQTEKQEYDWTHDPLTRKPLSKPVVSDSSGRLYNKDSIIEFILPSEDGEKQKEEAERVLGGRVKSLKDVVEVKFEVDETPKSPNGGTGRTEKWVCPITNKELGPAAKAVYIVPCGHAFAGSVVKELTESICPQCNEPYAENDAIPILPTSDLDIARLNLRIKTLKEKGLTHSLKKAGGSKKRKKNAEKATNGEATEVLKSTSEDDKKADKLTKSSKSSNGINNASTASLTAKVLAEEEARNKRRKMEQNSNVKSLFHSRDTKPKAANSADYMTRGFSVPGVGNK